MSNTHSPESYESALDLPSVVEMLEQLRWLKALTRFIARDQRQNALDLETEIRKICGLVDDFYALLGDRNWIYHDSLSVPSIEGIVKLPADRAEQELISIYKDPETLGFMIRQLNRFPQLRQRMSLIERAQKDFERGRHYATVLVLLAVMDGFVNDLEPRARRGLHTRDPDEMVAWDSVVGHHRGLTKAHKAFRRGFRKISDEEVHELYRNGIVHGMLTNFDNETVGSKAWNRLFAVADWASSLDRQSVPPDPQPSWRELLGRIAENRRTRESLDAWKPRVVEESDADIRNEPMFESANAYLAAWKNKNYGRMAQLLSPLVRRGGENHTAGMVREECGSFELAAFAVHRLFFDAPAVCEVHVVLDFGDGAQPARMRWIRGDAKGDAVAPNQAGDWRLVVWGPLAIINRAS